MVTLTRQQVADRILMFLNRELSLSELVDWAENTFVRDVVLPEDEMAVLNDVLMALAAADSPIAPLTVDTCFALLDRLGVQVAVIRKP
jgi:hypothetical protein